MNLNNVIDWFCESFSTAVQVPVFGILMIAAFILASTIGSVVANLTGVGSGAVMEVLEIWHNVDFENIF